MTTSATTGTGTAFPADPWHRHERHCYWDHTRCSWVCPPAPVGLRVEDLACGDAGPAPVPEPASRATL